MRRVGVRNVGGRGGRRRRRRFPLESQGSQYQKRFKRRGQFWSKAGFADFLELYVWYSNGELDCLNSKTD